MKGDKFTIFYATSLGLVCALLLTIVSTLSRPAIQANREADERSSILSVLGISPEGRATARSIQAAFNEYSVRNEILNGVNVYIYDSAGGPVTAVPFKGQGLWGPIKGFLSLAPDRTTIRSVTFYEQNETPGLGGEIGSQAFRRQFENKSIIPAIRIVRGGGATEPNEVDAITGATMTCEKVEYMINNAIRAIIQEGKADGN